MPRFRGRTTVEAQRLDWFNWEKMCDFAGVGKLSDGKPEKVHDPDAPIATTAARLKLDIPMSNGSCRRANEGDWIVREEDGELHPYDPIIFEQIYERVEE